MLATLSSQGSSASSFPGLGHLLDSVPRILQNAIAVVGPDFPATATRDGNYHKNQEYPSGQAVKRAIRVRFHYLSVLACVAVVFLAGCKTSNPLPVDFYSNGPDHMMPPVSIFGAKPSEELEAACSAARCIQGDLLVAGIYYELRRAKMFEGMAAGEDKSDYQIRIAARRIDPDDVKEFAKLMTSAASLFVVPVVMNHTYRGEFTVTWRGAELAKYNFDIPYEETVYLMKNLQQSVQFASESLASKFLAKAQMDGLFTSDFLYAALKAENYRKDLKAANQVGEYARTHLVVYPDPFLGAQLRYQRGKGEGERVDVFVYPARQIEWSDEEKVLAGEMKSVLKDIDIAVRAGAYKSAVFDAPQPVPLKNSRGSGKMAQGLVTGNANEQLRSYVYLFIRKDKIIKFRITQPQQNEVSPADVAAFVDEFLATLDVPDESFFTATLRQKTRNSTIQ